MTAPVPPPLTHGPDEGRNRFLIVVGGVLVVVVVIAAILITRDDKKKPPVLGGVFGNTVAAGNLPPPAAATVGLQVVSVSAPPTWQCTSKDAGINDTVTLMWTTVGAQSVSISIDDPTTPYKAGLPANGSLDVPAPCSPLNHTYSVTAIGFDGAIATRAVVTRGT